MTETLSVPADFEAIRAVGPWLRSVLEPLGPDRCAAMAGSIELAVHEIATNSIDHGQSTKIDLLAHLMCDSLEVTLIDDGAPYESPEGGAPVPEEPQVRGYGLMIVEALTESVIYKRMGVENEWTMRFVIASQ